MSEPVPDTKPAPEPKEAAKVEKSAPAPESEKSPAEIKAEKLAAKLQATEAKLKEHEDAKLSEQERASKLLEEQKAEAAKLRVVNTFLKEGFGEDLADAVISGDPAAIAKAIRAHVKAVAKQAAAQPVDPQIRQQPGAPSDPMKASSERNRNLVRKLQGLPATGT